MTKNDSFREKFQVLDPWLPEILGDIKKDLKQHHLKENWVFFKKYFPGKTLNKLSHDDLAAAYRGALAEDEEDKIGEFIANRWVLKNSEIYDYFEAKLNAISPDFDMIEELQEDQALDIMRGGVEAFGPLRTYIFSIFNSVVFPNTVYNKLADMAAAEQDDRSQREQEKREIETLENLKKVHEREMARISDRYEKKIHGLQKMYHKDTEALKKQISQLQRKLNG